MYPTRHEHRHQEQPRALLGDWPSNWQPSPLIIDGVVYNCVEQYMMAEKARCFGDTRAETLIMSTANPSDQKRYGRQAGPYDEAKWSAIRYDVVLRGTLEKYRQNNGLRGMLLDPQYDGITFVEASPDDRLPPPGRSWGRPRSAGR